MLVLTRTVSQSIKIGNDIEVFLVAVNGSQAKIGVVAPKNVPVMRTELGNYDAKKKA